MSESEDVKREITAAEKRLTDEEAKREFARELSGRNKRRPKPWPVCLVCRQPVEPGEMHWFYRNRCDSHGVNKLEKTVSRIARRLGRKLTLRLLKQLGN